MRKLILPLLLFLINFSKSQTIEVFSRGSYINQIARTGNKLYIATDCKGLIIYDLPTRTYKTWDVSNTPFTTNRVSAVQLLSEDTVFVTNSISGGWLVIHGVWKNIISNFDYAPFLSDNGSIYCYDGAKFKEYKNGKWQNPDFATQAGFKNRWISTDYHNHIISGNNRYINGMWDSLPVVPGLTSTGYIFDEQDTVYCAGKNLNNNGALELYQLLGNTWKFIPLPLSSEFGINAIVNDSNGHKYIFYTYPTNPSIGSGDIYLYDVNTGTTTALTGFKNTHGPINSGVYSYKGDFYFSSSYNGLITGNTTNGFSTFKYANIGLEERLEANITPTVESRDSFYVVDGHGDCFILDTSLNYCVKIDSIRCPKVYDYNRHFQFVKDHSTGDVWLLAVCDGSMRNLTTGEVINFSNYGIKGIVGEVYRYSNIIWVYSDSGVTVLNNGIVESSNLSFTPPKPLIDANGNLWSCYLGGWPPPSDSIFLVLSKPDGTYRTIRQWYDMNNFNPGVDNLIAQDKNANIWSHQVDTLFRYVGDTITYKIQIPHVPEPYGSIMQVFDSTEAVIITWDWIRYYKDGIWSYYPTKFSPWSSNFDYSFHDGRLLFLTNEDGILRYHLNNRFSLYGNTITGFVFDDTNRNNLKDSAEYAFTNKEVKIGDEIYSTNYFGQYSATEPNGNYQVTFNPPLYFTCAVDTYNVSFADTFFRLDSINFGCYANSPVNDLELHFVPTDFPIGYLGGMFATVQNNGTGPSNATVNMQYDTSLVSFMSCNYPVDIQTPGTIIIQVGKVLPQTQVTANIQFQVKANIPLNDSTGYYHYAGFTGVVSPIDKDTVPINNFDTTKVLLVSSFDPNDKTVEAPGLGKNEIVGLSQQLNYTIRFQNTGTYAAINIVLLDTLDSGLDVSTFKMIASSHPCSYKLTNHILQINFSSIYLPNESNDEPGSHGFFKYSINPVTDAKYGQRINNNAYIYFDFNPPVITNTTIVDLGAELHTVINNLSSPNYLAKAFPNPFHSYLKVLLTDDVSLPATASIFDITGRMITSFKIEDRLSSIYTGELLQGLYMVNIKDASNNYYRIKCIKTQ